MPCPLRKPLVMLPIGMIILGVMLLVVLSGCATDPAFKARTETNEALMVPPYFDDDIKDPANEAAPE